MRLSLLWAFAALTAASMASTACGGGGTTTSSTTGTTGSGGSTSVTTGTGGSTTGTGGSSTTGTGGSSTTTGTGGSSTTTGAGGGACTTTTTVDYASCSGTSFFPDGTCLAGECATVPLETRVFDEWKKQVKALSGLSDAQLAERVKVAKLSHSDGPDQVFVRIDYVVVLGWVRSRQADSPQLGNSPLQNAPSDAEITAAVKLAVEDAEWTGLGAIGQVAPEPATQAGFDACACDMNIDFCHIDFQNVSGKLLVKGIKQVNAALNQCKEARVEVSTGQTEACLDTPCSIN